MVLKYGAFHYIFPIFYNILIRPTTSQEIVPNKFRVFDQRGKYRTFIFGDDNSYFLNNKLS